ncbi:MAG: leucine-rich repeat domain-containing protein [Muribaculaceae bacterium]|nr:leucine-rich repeat domain-containing protein [Muribaculaceae bacterium]
MKKILRIPLLLVALLLTSIPLSAHDFKVDGIYYNITSSTDKTVAVTYSGGSYDAVANEYTGSVVIPEAVTYSGTTYSVTSIGECAFMGCTGLTSVTIPNSVTSIGESAFYGCTGLTEVNISDLFAWCKIDFSLYSNPLRYADKLKLNGTDITKLVIPNEITEIKDYAFEGYDIMTSVTIPNSVTTIGNSAFSDCTGLTSVTIGNSVTTIDNSAFSDCTGLTSVTIPNSVTSIGNSAFYGCTGLTSVTIPNSVTTIGYDAFMGCSGLTSVTIPNSVTSIGSSAFLGCSGLLEVNITDLSAWCKITFADSDSNPLYYADKLVLNGSEVIDLVIPNDITEIKAYAFYNCKGLTEVTIPNSVTSIGNFAFKGCTGLTSVTIPNSVTSIGKDAFNNCTGLTTVNFNATNCTTMGSYGYPVFEGCSNLKTVTIGNNVQNIPNYAFKGCTGLTSVTIPNSVTTIGSYAFYGCTGLTSVTIPNSVTTIGSYAFYGCTGLTSVTIPNSVTTIGSYAFYGCTGLTTVNFSATNCTTMGSSSYPVFSGCTNFTTLNIGDNVTNIPSYAFYGCTGLTSVTIPNSVSTIGSYAFYNCSNLASLSGGDGLSSIGTDAFRGCNKLIDGSVVATTQTTATIRLTSPTQYNLGLYYSDNDKAQAANGVAKLTGLKPGSTISSYDLALIINGIYCPIKDFSFTTQSFSAYLSGSTTTTSVSAIGTYTNGDVTILGEGINYGSSVTNYDGNNTITVYNLNPKTSYTIYYAVKTQEGGVYSTYKYFTTGDLTWSNGGFTATSTTSARLSVETNCDATAGTGFEWKRYDAPESLAPSKAPCPVVDGMLIGSLRNLNLNPDVYYKCRPYYTSSSGTTYYGEWITFFTGDANVYFEPEVRTFSERSVVNNSVTVKGYALPGTDDISEQGFEYWKVPASRATSTVMTVKASGISMTATLANLEYNSTYRYRAYVKTAQGTFYGAEEEFSTGEDPAGIEYIEVDDSNNFDVMLRENPATATAWVKVAGTSAIEAEYYILTTNGGVVANGFIPADGEYQPIELNIANGLYLMTVTDGSHRKTLRLIVR